MSQTTGLPSAASAQIVCGGILVATAAYAGVGVVLVRMGTIPESGFAGFEEGVPVLLSIILIVAGGSAAAVSFPFRRLMAARALPGGPGLAGRVRIAVMSMALAEMSGVMGLVYCLLTAELGTSLLLWGIGLGAGIFHFPTRSWLEGEAP